MDNVDINIIFGCWYDSVMLWFICIIWTVSLINSGIKHWITNNKNDQI